MESEGQDSLKTTLLTFSVNFASFLDVIQKYIVSAIYVEYLAFVIWNEIHIKQLGTTGRDM